ncbi:hypothetical protein V8E36_000703 [Tilletia maclaganii]
MGKEMGTRQGIGRIESEGFRVHWVLTQEWRRDSRSAAVFLVELPPEGRSTLLEAPWLANEHGRGSAENLLGIGQQLGAVEELRSLLHRVAAQGSRHHLLPPHTLDPRTTVREGAVQRVHTSSTRPRPARLSHQTGRRCRPNIAFSRAGQSRAGQNTASLPCACSKIGSDHPTLTSFAGYPGQPSQAKVVPIARFEPQEGQAFLPPEGGGGVGWFRTRLTYKTSSQGRIIR